MRQDWYFDFTVPAAGHYSAAGVFHHNTGKTFACLWRLDTLLREHAGSQANLIRKVRATMNGTVLQTFRSILRRHAADPVTVKSFGGDDADYYQYSNGSRLWVGGMDKPDKVLSSDRDYSYVNQAEELDYEDWAILSTRTTGRAGNAPYPMLFGDCNPGPPKHWLLTRAQLRLMPTEHRDNPTLWDRDRVCWTEQGKRTMAVLDALPGVLRDRLRDGRWVSAEGVVYKFSELHHLEDWFDPPADWWRLRSIDFGYVNPFVCQWWAVDPDGVMHLYREIYHTERTVHTHAAHVLELSGDESYETTLADHDREDRETLHECGIYTQPANKEVQPGIQSVEVALGNQRDGEPYPLVKVMRGCLVERDPKLEQQRLPLCTQDEFYVYRRDKRKEGRPDKDDPLKLFDHGMDALRYARRYVELRALAGGHKITTGGPPAGRASFRNSPGPAGSFRDRPDPRRLNGRRR